MFSCSLDCTYYGVVWNGVTTSWNPYVHQDSQGSFQDVGYYALGSLPCGTAGVDAGTTYWTPNSTIEYGYNPQRGANEYYQFLDAAHVVFNSAVHWNNTFDWTFTDCGNDNADGCAVAAHETGHVEGMGHTSHNAIMDEIGAPNQCQLTADDTQGITAIYPGNQQSN